jgi:hypothetical protein
MFNVANPPRARHEHWPERQSGDADMSLERRGLHWEQCGT